MCNVSVSLESLFQLKLRMTRMTIYDDGEEREVSPKPMVTGQWVGGGHMGPGHPLVTP